MKYTLVIFDMDGTILNTIDDLADSMNVILARHNYPLHTTEEIRFMVGNGIPKLVERAIPQNIKPDSTEYKDFLAEYAEYYKAHSAIKTRPYDGIVETIKQIRSMGIKTAVNTNKLEDAARILVEDYFKDCFDFLVGGKDGRQPKPAPDSNNYILVQAGITPEEAKHSVVYIGDSDVDVQTAQNSGMDFIGCDWGFRGEQFLKAHGAKITAKTPKDLLKYL